MGGYPECDGAAVGGVAGLYFHFLIQDLRWLCPACKISSFNFAMALTKSFLSYTQLPLFLQQNVRLLQQHCWCLLSQVFFFYSSDSFSNPTPCICCNVLLLKSFNPGHNAFQCGSSRRPSPRLCPQSRGHGLRQQSRCPLIPSCPAGRQISRRDGQGSTKHVVSEAVQLDGSAARWR